MSGTLTFDELKDLVQRGDIDNVLVCMVDMQWEQSEYDRRITDWELKHGFERH